MTHAPAGTLAYAFDIRQLNTGALVGIGLVAPSQRYLSLLREGEASAVTPALSAETWSEIDAWAADGDARLPQRPAPMRSQITGALVGAGAASTISLERFAAIPLDVASAAELAALVGRLLPDLLRARKLTA